MFTDNEYIYVENNAYFDYDFYDLTDCQYTILIKGSNENESSN